MAPQEFLWKKCDACFIKKLPVIFCIPLKLFPFPQTMTTTAEVEIRCNLQCEMQLGILHRTKSNY